MLVPALPSKCLLSYPRKVPFLLAGQMNFALLVSVYIRKFVLDIDVKHGTHSVANTSAHSLPGEQQAKKPT